MIDFIGTAIVFGILATTAIVFGILATVVVVMVDIYLHLDDDNFGV